MSKRVNNIFYDKIKFKNMLETFERAAKGKLKNKQECKEILKEIKKYLEELKLQLNDKTNYFKSSQGIVFCGYKVYKEYITLKKENKIKIRKKVKNGIKFMKIKR